MMINSINQFFSEISLFLLLSLIRVSRFWVFLWGCCDGGVNGLMVGEGWKIEGRVMEGGRDHWETLRNLRFLREIWEKLRDLRDIERHWEIGKTLRVSERSERHWKI